MKFTSGARTRILFTPIPLEDFNQLPEAGWELRERRIWSFSEADVAQITLHQNGQTRQIIHNGLNQWSLAPGSQGIIVPAAIEETAHQFGELTAAAWLAHDAAECRKFGFKPDNLSITFELKNGVKHTVDFGIAGTQTAVAAVTLERRTVGLCISAGTLSVCLELFLPSGLFRRESLICATEPVSGGGAGRCSAICAA